MNILLPFDTTWRDLRFTGRLARRQPWTVAAVIVSIAIGVGANTAVTSVLDTVLLNPLGIRNSEQLVSATVHMNKLQLAGSETSAAEWRDLQRMTDTFSAVTATELRAWTIDAGHPSRLFSPCPLSRCHSRPGVLLASIHRMRCGASNIRLLDHYGNDRGRTGGVGERGSCGKGDRLLT